MTLPNHCAFLWHFIEYFCGILLSIFVNNKDKPAAPTLGRSTLGARFKRRRRSLETAAYPPKSPRREPG